MPAGDHRRPTRVDTVTRHVDIDFRPILYAARSWARAPFREPRSRVLEVLRRSLRRPSPWTCSLLPARRAVSWV